MTPTLTIHTTASDFLCVAQAALEEDEVANNLMLGIASRLRANPATYSTAPFLATVSDEVGLTLAALMTPPYPLTLFHPRADGGAAYELIARHLLAASFPLRMVSGRVPVPMEFCANWARHTGQGYAPGVHMRIYKLCQVQMKPAVPGHMRVATRDNFELVAQWAEEFTREALPHNDLSLVRAQAQQRIDEGALVLWEVESHPVSMAARMRPLRQCVTVGYVYTPPELRGHGYATACVAALSQSLLTEGYKYCTLFTDLANPTSNSIYQKIGYQPVCDYDEYHLD